MTAMLKDISEGEGDLTKALDASGRDELAEVAEYFNRFVTKLRRSSLLPSLSCLRPAYA